jgi:hypothetical protein
MKADLGACSKGDLLGMSRLHILALPQRPWLKLFQENSFGGILSGTDSAISRRLWVHTVGLPMQEPFNYSSMCDEIIASKHLGTSNVILRIGSLEG